MMIQAPEKRKHKPGRKQKEATEVPHTEPQAEERVLTPSHDPLPSGEDRLQLNELMDICTKLSDRFLSLEQTKANQAAKIERLKKRVKKLKRKKKKKRTHGLKRLYKILYCCYGSVRIPFVGKRGDVWDEMKGVGGVFVVTTRRKTQVGDQGACKVFGWLLGNVIEVLEMCLEVDLETDEWIKDSGCSKHMTGNRNIFSSYKAYNASNVIFGSNLRGNIIGKGQICDNKCRVTFFEHDSEITKDGKVIGRGHANMRLVQSLASEELVRNLTKLKFDQHFCDACKMRKQAHASHKANNIVSTTRCLELPHMDLFGPFVLRSYRGNRYTLVIVDDYSRYTWTRFLKDKTEAFEQLEIFSKKIQNKLGCTIVSIRTDHGREFDNEVQFGEFCNANGIIHNFVAPCTPQSNGVVERKNRTLQEMRDESWSVAMQEELNQFIANDVWELVPQPRNMKIIGTKWVFINKLDENGVVSRNKARLEDYKPMKTPMSSDTKLTKDEEWTNIKTVVYADSNHAGDYVDQKSTSGICMFIGCCLTSWFSKKQTALAISTTEAKYVSTGKACQQALWMKQALIDYDVRLDDVPITCDNKGAINLSKNLLQHSRTKLIKIRHHFLRDNVQKGHISIKKVPSVNNIVDILTKPLKRESFNYLRLVLGMMEHIP
nr:hypothetical protein [Tanacetum cinerariifolium]